MPPKYSKTVYYWRGWRSFPNQWGQYQEESQWPDDDEVIPTQYDSALGNLISRTPSIAKILHRDWNERALKGGPPRSALEGMVRQALVGDRNAVNAGLVPGSKLAQMVATTRPYSPVSGYYRSNRGNLPSPTSFGKKEVANALQLGRQAAAARLATNNPFGTGGRRLMLPLPPGYGGGGRAPRGGGRGFDPRRLPSKYLRGGAPGRRFRASVRRPPAIRSRAARKTMSVPLLEKIPMSYLNAQRAPRSFRVV